MLFTTKDTKINVHVEGHTILADRSVHLRQMSTPDVPSFLEFLE